MTHSHNTYDASSSPAAYHGDMSPSSMLPPPSQRSPPFLPLPPPAALLLAPMPVSQQQQQQHTNSRFSPPLGLPPLPHHLDTSVLARMQPPPPPAVIAAAVLARAASLATKKFGGPPQTSPRLPQTSPHFMAHSASPTYQSNFSNGVQQPSASPPAPAALALPPPRMYVDCGAKSADDKSAYAAPDCGDGGGGGPSFTLPPTSCALLLPPVGCPKWRSIVCESPKV